MSTPRLIFCDGICGSGKSSTAMFVTHQLRRNGMRTRFMSEGSAVRIKSIHRPERESIPPAYLEGEILDPLEKVLCSPEEYIAQGLDAWRKFADEARQSDQVIVLDGHFFHAAADELLYMDADPELIAGYVPQIVDIISDLNPAFIHLYQRDVDASVRQTCTSRGRMWTRHQVDWKVEAPYGHRKGYKGFDGLVNVFSDLCDLCDDITKSLSIPYLQIDILDADWIVYNKQIMDFLSGVFGQTLEPKYKLAGEAPYADTEDGNIWFWSEPNVRDMKKLSHFECIQEYFELSCLPDLESLDGLESLKELGTFKLARNYRLTNLRGLRNVRKLQRLDLVGNTALESLDGLQDVEEFGGGVSIGYSFFKNLDELAFLSEVAFLYLSSNPELEDIEGLRFVKNDTGRLTVSDHRKLKSLEGLRNLERIGQEVIVSYNDRITNLDGLRSVTHMDQDLKIVHNPSLKNMDGLSNLHSVGDVYIVENSRLPKQVVEDFIVGLKEKGWKGKAVVGANGDEYDPGVQIKWC